MKQGTTKPLSKKVYELFVEHYEAWIASAEIEFINSDYYDVSMIGQFEVTDIGDVRLNSSRIIKDIVTPWEESEHHTDLLNKY